MLKNIPEGLGELGTTGGHSKVQRHFRVHRDTEECPGEIFQGAKGTWRNFPEGFSKVQRDMRKHPRDIKIQREHGDASRRDFPSSRGTRRSPWVSEASRG